MTATELVFLLDVDNTLLDNDRVKEDIRAAIAGFVAPDRASRFWSLYEEVRGEQGVVDFPETLRRFRRAFPDEPGAEDVDRAVLSVPFERYLYPQVMQAIARLWAKGGSSRRSRAAFSGAALRARRRQSPASCPHQDGPRAEGDDDPCSPGALRIGDAVRTGPGHRGRTHRRSADARPRAIRRLIAHAACTAVAIGR